MKVRPLRRREDEDLAARGTQVAKFATVEMFLASSGNSFTIDLYCTVVTGRHLNTAMDSDEDFNGFLIALWSSGNMVIYKIVNGKRGNRRRV